MKEREQRFIEEASYFVNEKEFEELKELSKKSDHFLKRAKVCGCINCRKDFKKHYMEYMSEYHRLTRPPNVDHEEELLEEYAIKRLFDE